MDISWCDHRGRMSESRRRKVAGARLRHHTAPCSRQPHVSRIVVLNRCRDPNPGLNTGVSLELETNIREVFPSWAFSLLKALYLELSFVYYYCVLFDRKNSQSQLLKALKEFCSGSKKFS